MKMDKKTISKYFPYFILGVFLMYFIFYMALYQEEPYTTNCGRAIEAGCCTGDDGYESGTNTCDGVRVPDTYVTQTDANYFCSHYICPTQDEGCFAVEVMDVVDPHFECECCLN